MNVEYPMLFNVTNRQTARDTHCGVLEFIAEEGVIYMPYWVCVSSCTHGQRSVVARAQMLV